VLTEGPVFSVAWHQVDTRTIEIGIAWCSPKDQFSRVKGRRIAAGRLLTRPFSITFKQDYHELRTEFVLKAIEQIFRRDPEMERDIVPEWALEHFGYMMFQPGSK